MHFDSHGKQAALALVVRRARIRCDRKSTRRDFSAISGQLGRRSIFWGLYRRVMAGGAQCASRRTIQKG